MDIRKLGFNWYAISKRNSKDILVKQTYLYYTKKEAVKLFNTKFKESESTNF